MNAVHPLPVPTAATSEPLRELRVHLQLPVHIWGVDCFGKAFSRVAHTVEISALGARLADTGCVQQGDVIGIQY